MLIDLQKFFMKYREKRNRRSTLETQMPESVQADEFSSLSEEEHLQVQFDPVKEPEFSVLEKPDARAQRVYVNRELSWLKFNERVLEEAADREVPLCERLLFLSIFQSNLEEFYMVRVGTLQDQLLLDDNIRDNKAGMTSKEQIEAILDETKRLYESRAAVYRDLKAEILKYGLREVSYADLSIEDAKYIQNYFNAEVAPILSPMIVGKKQSFPFMNSGAIYAVVVMETTKGKEKIGIIPCGAPGIERVVSIPGKTKTYMLVEEIILHFVNQIFENYSIKSKSLVKLTRNADIDVEAVEDEDLNYRDAMQEAIRQRKKLEPVKMEITRTLDKQVIRVLCSNLGLDSSRVLMSDVPLDTKYVSRIRDLLRSHTELFFPKFSPKWPKEIEKGISIISQVEKKDVLLSYPYDSMKPFLEMLEEAANDPNVVSIKMTLYRLAKNSKVVDTLIDAIDNGKEVVVLVELKARFDEANNIEYARELEAAGCQVIYGIDGVKVHSKLCQITRKVNKKLEYITQIGTGNYNEMTAELYSDLTLITASPVIGSEIANVFKKIGLGELAEPEENILVAPNGLQNRLLEMITDESNKARAGEPAYIAAKINSLTDIKLLEALVEASKAGVKIQLLVRGICCILPGIPGETENIEVVSIVGRYLEHSRMYIFGAKDPKIYIGSADWMTRNTLKRIEICTPIFQLDLKERILSMFQIMWNDQVKGRKLKPDGTYIRVDKKRGAKSAQDILIAER